MTRTRRLGPKEWLILRHLARRGESYGRAMVESEPGIILGSVYVLLKRLETRGLVQGRSEGLNAIGSPGKRFYRLTPDGAKEYADARNRPQGQIYKEAPSASERTSQLVWVCEHCGREWKLSSTSAEIEQGGCPECPPARRRSEP